jgi:hypothetical protein
MSLVSANFKPDRGQLRGFGVVCLVAFAALGVYVYFWHRVPFFELSEPNARTTGIVLGAVAVVCFVLGRVAPSALRPLWVTLMAITLPIGFVVSHVVLGIVYYGVFTPVGLLFRLIGRDPLDRRFEPARTSYWVARKPVTDVKRYFRQY